MNMKKTPVLLLVVATWTLGAFAQSVTTDVKASTTMEQAVNQQAAHDPLTFKGIRMRTDINVPLPGTWGELVPVSMGPALFQQILPCRFIDTVSSDNYPSPFGGPAFGPNEARAFKPFGPMYSSDWHNPCEGRVPGSALAVALRIYELNATADGTLKIAPGMWSSPIIGLPVINYTAGSALMEETVGMIAQSGKFWIGNYGDGSTDVIVDILGYFLKDTAITAAVGPEGPEGPSGPPGPSGPVGPGIAATLTGNFGEENTLTLYNSAITNLSILLCYDPKGSDGCKVFDYSTGQVTIKGKKNNDYFVVVLNPID